MNGPRPVFGAAVRPTSLRFPRSLDEAFACERAPAITHFVSNRMRHRFMRLVRRLLGQ